MQSTDEPVKAALTVRIDADLRKRIRVLAAREDKSMARWVEEALAFAADHEEAQRAE